MRVSSLIHFTPLAIPHVTGRMSFDIRAQVELADKLEVRGRHKSEYDFVEMPRDWPKANQYIEFCIDEAGKYNYGVSNGECGDKPLYTMTAAFPNLIKGKNYLDISGPGYILSCNFIATDNGSTIWVMGWGLSVYEDNIADVHMICFNQTVWE